jgi:hypothetical protein
MKHPVTPKLLCFRRFLPLCNQCNRISRCGRDAENAGRRFQRECGGQPVATACRGMPVGTSGTSSFIRGGPGLEQPGHEQADKVPQTDLWSVRVQFAGQNSCRQLLISHPDENTILLAEEVGGF